MNGAMVYLLANRNNGKAYVGQTTRALDRRWVEHAGHKKTPLGRAIAKHGREAFSAECIVSGFADAPALDAAERFWIGVFNCRVPHGYNLIEGGQSGRKHHESTCSQLSAIGKVRYLDPAERAKTAAQLAAVKADPAAEARRVAHLRAGIRASEKHKAASRAHMAKLKEAKPWLKAQASRRIPVIASKEGSEQQFPSACEAAAALGVSKAAVSMCLSGKKSRVRGYTFRKAG